MIRKGVLARAVMANLIRRTLYGDKAPILNSLRRVVPQVALARSLVCSAKRHMAKFLLKRNRDDEDPGKLPRVALLHRGPTRNTSTA
jgi:hypothetical protein